jgi:hypothetical protein
MPPELIDKIRQVGHWRVNIRPNRRLVDELSFQQCTDLVTRKRVSIRGWDFPHLSTRNDEQTGFANIDNYIEHWIEWDMFLEFWRMYKSGQFLTYKALNRDVLAGENYDSNNSEFHVVDAIYTVSEFVEFAQRLVDSNLLGSRVSISVSLLNASNRRLVAGRNRIPFFEENVCQTQHIELSGILDRGGSEETAKSASRTMLLELFDYFGWNPQEDQIRADQDAFYRREFM